LKAPAPHPRAAQLRAAEVAVVVHAPYPVNLASTNNRVRVPSRKIVTQHAAAAAQVGAFGLVVHGGHVARGEDPAVGVDNWRRFLVRQADEGGFAAPILVENTAGGDAAMARRFDALARHAGIGAGTVDPELLVAVCARAGAPVVVETPAHGQAADITLLRDRLR